MELAIRNIEKLFTEADAIKPSPPTIIINNLAYFDDVVYSVGKAVDKISGNVAHDLIVSYAFYVCYPVDPI